MHEFYQEKIKDKKEKANAEMKFTYEVIKALRQPKIVEQFGQILNSFSDMLSTEAKREKLI